MHVYHKYSMGTERRKPLFVWNRFDPNFFGRFLAYIFPQQKFLQNIALINDFFSFFNYHFFEMLKNKGFLWPLTLRDI